VSHDREHAPVGGCDREHAPFGGHGRDHAPVGGHDRELAPFGGHGGEDGGVRGGGRCGKSRSSPYSQGAGGAAHPPRDNHRHGPSRGAPRRGKGGAGHSISQPPWLGYAVGGRGGPTPYTLRLGYASRESPWKRDGPASGENCVQRSDRGGDGGGGVDGFSVCGARGAYGCGRARVAASRRWRE
ncbi:hypothetical protein T484DRAFT_1900639, partial [Baffinella frigidus]